MTFDIALVLSLLGVAVVLFVVERPRADVVALMLLTALALTKLLEPLEALAGFSNPAVVTVWAVFILSGGLSKTGVANMLGQQVLRLAGGGEVRLLVLIMLVSGVLSAFMNNVGATALLLPVVMDLARRTGIPASKLLIPLSFSALLGGMLTLIGTPPNILIAETVKERGLADLGMFSFTPVGGAVLIAGIVYMALIGRHLLPSRDLEQEARAGGDVRGLFGLHKRLLVLRLPEDSVLEGRTLAECRIRPALGLTVIGILRGGRTRLAPAPNDLLQGGDQLLVEGRPSRLEELRDSPSLAIGRSEITLEAAVSGDMQLAAVRMTADSALVGKTLREVDFRRRFGGAVVLALQRESTQRESSQERPTLLHSQFDTEPLRSDDVLVLQASPEEIEELTSRADFEAATLEDSSIEELDSHLLRLGVPEDSFLVDKTLADSRIAEAFGLMVLGLERGQEHIARPGPDVVFQAGDALLVKGDPADLEIMRGLQALEVERRAEQSVDEVESAEVGLAVVAISPNSRLVRKSLRDLHFREKYGLSVLAIWRQGHVLRAGLGNEKLIFGDALLLHGQRDKLVVLAAEPDFLVLTEEVQAAPRTKKAPVALLVMGGVLAMTLSGFMPIYIAAVVGATAMILTGCLSIEEAYREIEWRAVFLIAGMLPLGTAMAKTGAALYVSDAVVALVGDAGPLAILGGLFVLAVLGAQVMPTPAVALLLAPIAIDTAIRLDVSPISLVMAVAIGASTSFISPVTHPANVLVMGPGGYRFIDYAKVGLPLALVTLLVVLFVLPLVWPLQAG